MKRTTIPSMAFFSPSQISAAVSNPKEILTTTLFVTNLHCASCVTHVQDAISPLRGILKVDVNLHSHTICVQHEPGVTESIADVLLDAAFEVRHVTTSDMSGCVVSTHDVSSKLEQLKHQNKTWFFMSNAQKKHRANCRSCQSKAPPQGVIAQTWRSITRRTRTGHSVDETFQLENGPEPNGVDHELTEKTESSLESSNYVATISIVGMTCASCTHSITTELQQLDIVGSVEINLLSNNAKITFRGQRSDTEAIIAAIEDVGFEASIDKVEQASLPGSSPKSYKALISIEGMTCGSCVASVTRGLESIDGLTSVNVDLVGNCATVHIVDRLILDKVLEAIEDLGFDGSLAEFEEQTALDEPELQYRHVEFEITGMYCPACPDNIIHKVEESFGKNIRVVSRPSLKTPRFVLSYKPAPPELSIRRIKYAIESADPVIVASVYHSPSIEERSHTIHRKESSRILRHLLFTLVAAIPSFVIGIVFMSLMPEDNATRKWFEEPMWLGYAMRMDWAMFIVTTPVFFYGASMFHTRALREIWSLWRPKSKTPVLRRLYRFGSMNLLISAGTSVAYFSSLAILVMEATTPIKPEGTRSDMETRHSITYFDTVTFLTLFILCGKFLQAYSKSRTGDAIAMLGKLRPTEALLVEQIEPYQEGIKSSTRSVPIDLLEIGDVVSIPHGASPPTDGVIDQDGTFLFDESSLTGESKPVRKTRGNMILTGSVNASDPVKIMVKELGGKSMLDQIIAVVRNGQAKRAPVERFADFVTSYFTPVVTLIAISTWVVWLGLGQSGALPQDWLDVDQGGWAFWSVEFAIAVFVVACPCGLGLAAPTALFVGGGLAANAGILVQGGGEAFQEASKLDAIVFDKTGTLTEGQMRVTEMQMLDRKGQNGMSELMLHMVEILEEASTHPIAKAIAKFCKDKKVSTNTMSLSTVSIRENPGHGMQGTFEVRRVDSSEVLTYEAAIGNERQLSALDQRLEQHGYLALTLRHLQSTGCSTAIFSIRQVLANDLEKEPPYCFDPQAVFAVADPIRAEATSVLASLRSQNISVHMCTGDNETTARAIASQLDIPVSNVRAGVLPQDKASYIQELQQQFCVGGKRKIIAFVGDGTNDTPALTIADVSIALSSGSDIALTSSSFILLNSNLTTILHLVRLAKRVFLRVKLNFAWAAVYNVCLIPVAAGVFFPIAQWRLSPVWAAAAMAGSSVSVVLSSLALRLPEIKGRRNDSRY